jgi:molybdopterin molybdotransferase
VRDEAEALRQALRESADCDAIVTSGGVSMGDFDPVRDVLPTVADVHFWKIAMKPGKPVMFATLLASRFEYSNNASRAKELPTPVFGLPGNPVSVMVAFEQFVRPALLHMQERRVRHRVTLRVQVQSGFTSPAGKTEFARARVFFDEQQNVWRAVLPTDQSSGRLSTMTQANALLVVPPEVTQVSPQSFLIAQMTDWPETDKPETDRENQIEVASGA